VAYDPNFDWSTFRVANLKTDDLIPRLKQIAQENNLSAQQLMAGADYYDKNGEYTGATGYKDFAKNGADMGQELRLSAILNGTHSVVPAFTYGQYIDPKKIQVQGDVLQMLKADRQAVNPLDPASSAFGYNLTAGYGGQSSEWDDDAKQRLATMVSDSGKTAAEFQAAMRARGDGGSWWGPEATIQAMATALGADPAKYVNQDALQDQQKRAATVGNEAQAKNGGTDAFMLQGLAVVGLGAGFAAALGAGSTAASGLADVQAAASAAGDSGFLTAGGVTTPQTGGMFVGDSGLLGGTGNAIADAALNGAVRGGVTSVLTGGDVGKGLISGGISGGIGATLPGTGNAILDTAAKGAVTGGVGAAVNGGDILTGAAAGGAASGFGALVRDAIPTSVGGNTLTNAAAGGVAGAVGSAIAGGDVATGLIRGAVTGGTSGALQDAGVDSTVAGAVGTAAGGLVTSPSPDAGTPAAQQQDAANQVTGTLGFASVLPQFQNNPRRDMQWGTRLKGN